MTQRIYRLSLLLFYLLQVTYKLKDKASNSYFLRVFKDEREASGGNAQSRTKNLLRVAFPQ